MLTGAIGHPTRIIGPPWRLDFTEQKASPWLLCWFIWDGWGASESVFKVVPKPHHVVRNHGKQLRWVLSQTP
jgi:hypothetical protein